MSIILSRCRNCFACSAVHLFVAVPVPFVHPSRNSFVIVVYPRPIIESFASVSAGPTLNRPLNVFVHCCSVLYSSNWKMAAARVFNEIARGFSPRPIIESFAPVSARRTLNRPLNVFVHCCSVLYSSNWKMAAARVFNEIARGFSCTSAPPHVYSSNRKPNHRGSHKKRSFRCLHTTSSRLLLNRTKS